MPALVNAIEDAPLRSRAKAALTSIGPARAAALPDLVAALGSPSSSVRSRAAEEIGKVVSPSADSVAALVIALGDADKDVSGSAEAALIKAVCSAGEGSAVSERRPWMLLLDLPLPDDALYRPISARSYSLSLFATAMIFVSRLESR